jgi:hypothetical protein
MDTKEERRKKDRERYKQMTNEKKEEMLKKRHEAYKQKRKKMTETCAEEEKEEMLKKRREAYQQKKRKELEQRTESFTEEEKEEMLKKRREAYQQKKRKEPEERTKVREQDRQRYANMQPEQKKAKIEQVRAYKLLKRSTPCKESIAMVNPAYIETEQEVSKSTVNVRQRKSVTAGERQTLLQRRNEEFSTKQRKSGSVSSQEDTSMMNSDNNGKEPLKQPEVMINGNTSISYNTKTFQKTIYNMYN